MALYNIYADRQGRYEAVKQGWSWPAFLFLALWAIYKRMWEIGIGVFLVMIFLDYLLRASGVGQYGELLGNIAAIVINFIFGNLGNAWREESLLSRGFEYLETVNAPSPKEAVALHKRKLANGKGSTNGASGVLESE